jgi:hypothetical protein
MGAVGAVTFDLTSVKAFLQSARLTPTTVRASLRVTPIRALTAKDAEPFVTGVSPAPPTRTSTAVALLDMPSAPIRTISIADFPGLADLSGAARSSLDELEQAIAQAPAHRKASVPLGSSANLSQLNFDVSDALQRELQGQSPVASVGFLLASELNATSVIFADSSWAVPGAREILAPHLVLELPGFRPANMPQFVVSTTSILFDRLRVESRDLLLVTVSNVGGRSGKVQVNLPGGNAFALMPAPGAQLHLDNTNSATVPAGSHLTFGVAFQPRVAGSDPESVTLPILDATTNRRREVGRILLDGLGVPDESSGVPPIVAPIVPPEEFIATSSASPMTKAAGMLWLLGSLLLVGLLTVTRVRSRQRRQNEEDIKR